MISSIVGIVYVGGSWSGSTYGAKCRSKIGWKFPASASSSIRYTPSNVDVTVTDFGGVVSVRTIRYEVEYVSRQVSMPRCRRKHDYSRSKHAESMICFWSISRQKVRYV